MFLLAPMTLALTSLAVLRKVATIFKLAERLAGLAIVVGANLVSIKCKSWINQYLPNWSDISIAASAKYLGVHLGTVTKDLLWMSRASKWKSRVDAIAATGSPPSISVMLYNTRALPTLSYVAQLAFPPRDLCLQEPAALARVMHCPCNAFSRADYFNLGEWGSVHIDSLYVYLLATLVRSALNKITSWATCYDMLASREFRTLRMLAVGDLSPPHWDTVPIAQTLHGAAHGFPDHPLLGSVMPKIIHDVLKLRKCCPDGGRFRLQRSIASVLRKTLYPESIPSLIKRRFSILRPGVPYGSIDMDALKNFMMSLSVAWSTCIFKTWARWKYK